MKKFVKIFVILGIVLCLCGGIVTAAGYIGGGFRELTGKVSSSIPAVQSAKAQESLTFSPNVSSFGRWADSHPLSHPG